MELIFCTKGGSGLFISSKEGAEGLELSLSCCCCGCCESLRCLLRKISFWRKDSMISWRISSMLFSFFSLEFYVTNIRVSQDFFDALSQTIRRSVKSAATAVALTDKNVWWFESRFIRSKITQKIRKACEFFISNSSKKKMWHWIVQLVENKYFLNGQGKMHLNFN